ncbi:unnamed protein product [Meganyctiphanes norvegica]|uniref:Lipase domain-containing protein n=1 Tax=Meganyctiphanes norvegica TaxID=48144 RepID=A0AAV2RQX4_MEGNR
MPAVGAVFHMLNMNLLMHLGPEPGSVPDTSYIPPKHEYVCHQMYGQNTCFSLVAPWVGQSRPIIKEPMSPGEIGTTFSLFTRENDTVPLMLNLNDLGTVISAPYRPGAPFKILTHGYLSYGTVGWMKKMIAELLRKEDQNVIVVDWAMGARPPYTQCVANIRLIGKQVGHLIYSLTRWADIPIERFHAIGHSLGAHVFGYTGHHLQETHALTLPRITGLDPAEPYFNDTAPITRLDPTDAQFVDIVHTDSTEVLGFPISVGMTDPIGHLDFYPNGDNSQPGCGGGTTCQHIRAISLFTESIRGSCSMTAVACPSYEQFLNGECWGCSGDYLCNKLGVDATPLPLPEHTKLFVATKGRAPFCGYHYRVSIQVSNSSEAQYHEGEFVIVNLWFKGTKDKSTKIQLTDRSVFYEAGTVHRRVILTNDLGELRTMGVSFVYPRSFLNPISWRLEKPVVHMKSITIEPLGKDKKWTFCFKEDVQETGKDYMLRKTELC